uniref:LysR substrate-binding domain-containing protein n=1 Tax=uncultured Caulobacter sp. TaxID=158749 RepID=UPI0025DCCA21|nr:LysR substrate-binding domain-containing protein [uncultured Caulobacter sp.]
MNLSLIEAFNAVMKSGSTTGAAQLLGISQPAISRALKRLEDTTRLKLFERSGPRLTPTPEAHLLHQEILDTYVGLDRLRQTVARIRAVGAGALRIASSAALGLTFAPKAITAFAARRPNVSITFEIANSATVRNLVASGVYDVGLCADEIDTANLVAQPFITTRGVCVMRPDHPLAQVDTIVPSMLKGQALISLAPDDTARKRFDQALAAAGVSPQITVETQFAATVCEFAARGLGLGLTNSLAYLSGGYETAGLTARPFFPAIPFRSLLILPPHRARSRLLDELIAALEAERDLMSRACAAQFGEPETDDETGH